jgi:hypothetical protein
MNYRKLSDWDVCHEYEMYDRNMCSLDSFYLAFDLVVIALVNTLCLTCIHHSPHQFSPSDHLP